MEKKTSIIDKYHVFMTLTVSNSVGKHVENEAFAHTGKLQKNFQENRLFVFFLSFTEGEQ